MSELLQVAHHTFLGHGFKRSEAQITDWSAETAAMRVQYVHESRASVTATFVPVQSHLVVYAAQDGAEATPTRTIVTVGMASGSVLAKVDYVLLSPLIFRCCTPELRAVPAEALFGLLTNLSLPALAAVGSACRALASSVKDDLLWWQVLLALPPTDRLTAVIQNLVDMHKTAAPGTYRRAVRDEVECLRRDRAAEEERRRQIRELREDALRRQREMRLPPDGRALFPSRGLPIIGGDYDLVPGGGAFPGRGGGFGGGFGGGGGLGPGGFRPFG